MIGNKLYLMALLMIEISHLPFRIWATFYAIQYTIDLISQSRLKLIIVKADTSLGVLYAKDLASMTTRTRDPISVVMPFGSVIGTTSKDLDDGPDGNSLYY